MTAREEVVAVSMTESLVVLPDSEAVPAIYTPPKVKTSLTLFLTVTLLLFHTLITDLYIYASIYI